MLTSNVFRLSSEEEERAKQIILHVKDWLFKIKINIIHQNIDLCQELQTLK